MQREMSKSKATFLIFLRAGSRYFCVGIARLARLFSSGAYWRRNGRWIYPLVAEELSG
jgi:hypothetical protein